MTRPERQSPPAANRGAKSVTDGDSHKTTPGADLLADVDALAEHLNGYLVVQVVVDDDLHRRTYLYRSAAAAQRCVERARSRGRWAHVTLCSLHPASVVTSLTAGNRGGRHA